MQDATLRSPLQTVPETRRRAWGRNTLRSSSETAWHSPKPSAWGLARDDSLDKTSLRPRSAAAPHPAAGSSAPRSKSKKKKVPPAATAAPRPSSAASFGLTADMEGTMYARLLAPKLLCEEDPRVRRWAAQALGSIGGEARAQVGVLTKALEDTDDSVRTAATHALRVIRGRSASTGFQARRRRKSIRRRSTSGGRKGQGGGAAAAISGRGRSVSLPGTQRSGKVHPGA